MYWSANFKHRKATHGTLLKSKMLVHQVEVKYLFSRTAIKNSTLLSTYWAGASAWKITLDGKECLSSEVKNNILIHFFPEKSLTLFHEVDGVAARQTRHNQDALNVPEFGYLSSDRDPAISTLDPNTSRTSAATSEKLSISMAFTFLTTLIATRLVMWTKTYEKAIFL